MENKYLLSLDGGGVRELASVIFLSKLEKALGKTFSLPTLKRFLKNLSADGNAFD